MENVLIPSKYNGPPAKVPTTGLPPEFAIIVRLAFNAIILLPITDILAPPRLIFPSTVIRVCPVQGAAPAT